MTNYKLSTATVRHALDLYIHNTYTTHIVRTAVYYMMYIIHALNYFSILTSNSVHTPFIQNSLIMGCMCDATTRIRIRNINSWLNGGKTIYLMWL